MKPADTLTRTHTTSKTHSPGQTARIFSGRGHGHEANIPTVPGQTHLKTTASTTHTGDLQEHWSRQTRGSVHCQTGKEEKGPGERSGVCECQSAQPLNLGKFLGAEQGSGIRTHCIGLGRSTLGTGTYWHFGRARVCPQERRVLLPCFHVAFGNNLS